MGTRCYFHYNFHPVGQGLFSSGLLQFGSQRVSRSFSWVYDCGSLNESLLSREIQRWKTRRPSISGGAPIDSLDLMILSHFDKDHVVGMGNLVTGQTLHWLVLPYLTPGQRLLIGAMTKPDTGPDFFRFLVEPVPYLTALNLTLNLKIENIIFVLPGGELAAPEPPSGPHILPEGRLGHFRKFLEVDERILRKDPGMSLPRIDGLPRSTGPTPRLPTVRYIDGGQPFELIGLWEFCFYNLPRPQLEQELWDRMKGDYYDFCHQPQHGRDYDGFIGKLKEVYDKVFGRSSRNRNDISLMTYTGPLIRDVCPKRLWCPWPSDYLPIYFQNSSRKDVVDDAGLLYCGDINMTRDTRRMVEAHFKRERWSQIKVLQVPHHGSKNSWHINSPRLLWPQSWSVFSSARSGWYRHPHKAVVADLENNSPVFVNEFQGAHWGGYIDWP